MKKIYSIFLFFIFIIQTSFAFEDALVDSLDKNLKIKKSIHKPIVDDVVRKNLKPTLKIKKQTHSPIEDNLAKNIKTKRKIKNKVSYNYTNPTINSLTIKPIDSFSTKNNENSVGKYLDFTLAKNLTLENKTYKKGTTIKGRIENVKANDIMGIPSELIIGNFILPDNKLIEADLTIDGANRAFWLIPTIQCTNMFFGLGFLLYPIRGGHAKLKTQKIYTIEF